MSHSTPTLLEIAAELRKTMQCNCDLDKWQPDLRTGHTFVCRIHQTAIARFTNEARELVPGWDK